MAAILNFRIFFSKHKNAYISKSVLDRMISKFFSHRVSLRSSHPNIQKVLVSPKNGHHFEFLNFLQKLQKKKNACISKTVLDRAILTKFLTHSKVLKKIQKEIWLVD